MLPASQHYATDPIPADTALTSEEQKRILGGEATMWSEWVSPETIDSRIWPRTAAIAERLWSPREVNEVDDMYRRLALIEVQLEELGLTHIRNRAVLLRRLTNGQEISALKTLVSLVEPVKVYRRYQVRPQTMLSPLTGSIDAAQADAAGARKFNELVGKIAVRKSLSSHAAKLKIIFAEWKNTGIELKAVFEKAPALAEAKQFSTDLQELGDIGLATVELLETAKTSDSEWREAKLARLAEIAKQKAGLEFQVIEAMKVLVVATSGN
jgi:hexosaminidase